MNIVGGGGVDHDAEVVKALFCDVVVKVLLEVEVRLLERA